MDRVNWWKNVYSKNDVQIMIVSPGNQKGGLANILEKSLGATMKGGTTETMEVYKYAEKVKSKALFLWIHQVLISFLQLVKLQVELI